MKKPKMSLTEELRKFDHITGYEKDFTLEESKNYTKEIKNRTYDLKVLTEEEAKVKYKNYLTEANNPELILEFIPALAGLITRVGGGALLRGAGGLAARGASLFKNFPRLGRVLGFAKTGIRGSSKGWKAVANPGTTFSTAGQAIANGQAIQGLKSIFAWGTGIGLINAFASGSKTPLPGDAVAGQQNWAEGESIPQQDFMSMCFAPEYYESLKKLDADESDITITFQSEGTISQLATIIYEATEEGEKYFGKGIVDFITFGATEGAGTDEDAIFGAFESINTVGDCSHLAKLYHLKYDTHLVEELYDELDENDLNRIYNILKQKPLTIMNGKKVFTKEDMDELMAEEAKEVIQRPEGMPAYRLNFKSLFDGKTVDLFVGLESGNATMAIVFYAGSKDYLGQFQYIENSDEKYYFETPEGQVYAITDEEDKAKLAKVFSKADDEKDAQEDIMVLTKPIEVGGVVYEVDENLSEIEGPEGTADEYIDELVSDNPTTASKRPTALQGAAIALAMGVKDFEVLAESVVGLARVLGESRIVVEQKYTVNFNREDNKYKISRVRRGGGESTVTPKPKPRGGETTSSGVAPTLTSVAAGNGIIRKGMKGDSVSSIQRLLNISPVTGVFDATTEQAVKDYQSGNRLKVDGIVGPETANQMIKGMDSKNERDNVAGNQTDKEIKNISGKFTSKDAAEKSLKNLEKVNDTKATREECIMVIGSAAKALPTLGGPNTYQVLQYCYAAYNFSGKESRRVKRKYGITHKGDLRNKRRRR